ncbi:MAG: MFS transporter [Proteobacteria bacterium]|nr:MFS transporter [Pseudomonadota bacterium]MBU1639283.1 MFS transporter [Pseudomonadota bacterium]
MNTRERSILGVTCFGHFMSHFNMLVFPAVLLPLTGSLHLSMTDTLALSFWMYLLFGLTALPWGLAADRFGPRRLLGVFHLGAGLCGFWAAANIGNPNVLWIALAGIGLFSGIYHPAGLGWIAKEVENTSRGMAYNGMFGNLGLATAPVLAGTVNYFWGTRMVYIVLGIINLGGLVLLAMSSAESTAVGAGSKKKHQGNSLPAFLVLLVAMTLGGIVYRGTSVTLPAYFELQSVELYQYLTKLTGGLGSANVVATLLTSFIFFIGIAGQYTGGWVGERFKLTSGYLLFHLITIPMALAMAASTNGTLVFFAMIHGFFLLGMQPLENTLVARLTPANFLSSAYGMKFILTFGVGALSVKMVGLVKSSWGFPAVYQTLAGFSTLLVLAIIILIKALGRPSTARA